MSDNKRAIEEQFIAWLAQNAPAGRLSELYLCYPEIEKHCLRIKVLKKPLFETTDLDTIKKVQKTISESRMFQLAHKKHMKRMVSAAQYYTTFIKEHSVKSVEPVQSEPAESAAVEEPLKAKNLKQNKTIQNYYPNALKASETPQSNPMPEVQAPVSEDASTNAEADSFDGLLADERFSDLRSALLSEGISSAEAPQEESPAQEAEQQEMPEEETEEDAEPEGADEGEDADEDVLEDTEEPEYIPKVFPSLAQVRMQKAEKYLLERDLAGGTYDELQTYLRYTMSRTKDAVAMSPHIVEMNHRLYHDEAFVDFEEGADAIEDILNKLLKKNNGIATATQLWEYARSEMSMFLNDNDITEQQAMYDLARHLFEKLKYHGKCYFFRSNIYISLPEVSADSINGIMQKYAREKGTTVTFEEMESYLKSLGLNRGNLRGVMRIDKEPIFLIYQENEYLLAELIHMDDAFLQQVKTALKRLFLDVGDHIILRHISNSWYNLLPTLPASLDWTPMLLQQLLHFYSGKLGARTIIAMDSQSSNTLHAMLVDNDSWIQDFRDAVAIYIHDELSERKSFEAEELRRLLVEAGMVSGNELIWHMHKALGGDPRFLWDGDGNKVTVRI